MKRLILARFKVFFSKVENNLKKTDLTSETKNNFQGYFCLKRFLGYVYLYWIQIH